MVANRYRKGNRWIIVLSIFQVKSNWTLSFAEKDLDISTEAAKLHGFAKFVDSDELYAENFVLGLIAFFLDVEF